jgi:Coenzyme PQQ synthesis protein D (PqqD)
VSITLDSKVQRNASVAFRRLAEGEGGVLLHLETGQYHGINEVGCLIWELVDGERTVDEVTTGVRERVEDPPDDLPDVVVTFLESLRERNLVA